MDFERLTKEQIIKILNVDSHSKARELGRELGVSLRTIYGWRKRLQERDEYLDYIVKFTNNKKLQFPNIVTPELISNELNIPIFKAKRLIELLLKNNIRINLDTNNKINIEKFKLNSSSKKIGILGDTHLNSIFEALDFLNFAYDEFKKEGVEIVLHAGNIIDGFSNFNKFEVKNIGIDTQIKYLIENYPKREGIKTYFITADEHENWSAKLVGLNIGNRIESLANSYGRDDLKFIGYIEANLTINDTKIRIIHPGKGTTLGISLRFQQLVDKMLDKPDLLIVGHYHKLIALPYKNVMIIGSGCFQYQTTFMKKKNIIPDIGFWIADLNKNDNISLLGLKLYKLNNFRKEVINEI